MKRYDIDSQFREGGLFNPGLKELPNGRRVSYDDAIAEIDALKAEVSKLCAELTDAGAKELALHNQLLSAEAELAALKAPPKVLSAEEVKEPGCYWWRREENTDWSVQNVYLPGAGKLLVGQFIGPIPKPEVCDD